MEILDAPTSCQLVTWAMSLPLLWISFPPGEGPQSRAGLHIREWAVTEPLTRGFPTHTQSFSLPSRWWEALCQPGSWQPCGSCLLPKGAKLGFVNVPSSWVLSSSGNSSGPHSKGLCRIWWHSVQLLYFSSKRPSRNAEVKNCNISVSDTQCERNLPDDLRFEKMYLFTILLYNPL